MRFSILFSFLSLLLVGAPALANERDDWVVIENASIVPMDEEGVLEGHEVIVHGGRIHSIVQSGTAAMPEAARRFDASGLYLLPGFREGHAHVTVYDSAAQQEVEGLALGPARFRTERRLKAMLSAGIVAVRDPGMAQQLIAMARDLRARDDLPYLSFAGPVIDGPRNPYSGDVEANIESPEDAAALIEALAREGVDFIKIYHGVSPETFAALAKAARERNLAIAGHIPFNMTTRDAVAGGMTRVEHTYLQFVKDCTELGNAASFALLGAWIEDGYEGRWAKASEIYRSRDAEACRALYRDYGKAGLFVTATPQMDMPLASLIGEEELAALSANGAEVCRSGLANQAGADPEVIARWQADLTEHYRELIDAGVRLVAGSDAANDCMGFGRTLIATVELMGKLGLTNFEAIEMLTANAADLMGEEGEGRIVEGARADLVLLGANPLEDLEALHDVRAVMLHGNWVGDQ